MQNSCVQQFHTNVFCIYRNKTQRNETMTKSQLNKLNTIIGKIESLQADCENKTQKETDALRSAKSRLIELLK